VATCVVETGGQRVDFAFVEVVLEYLDTELVEIAEGFDQSSERGGVSSRFRPLSVERGLELNCT
jgi:hypothetical protein